MQTNYTVLSNGNLAYAHIDQIVRDIAYQAEIHACTNAKLRAVYERAYAKTIARADWIQAPTGA